MDSRPLRTAILADLLAALAKRRRAIRYRVRSLTAEKIIERGGSGDLEKVEIEAVLLGNNPPTSLRLYVWGDRWVWVDARAHQKAVGWLWEFTYQGRASGELLGAGLVQAFEASLDAASGGADSVAGLAEIWSPRLAGGPRQV